MEELTAQEGVIKGLRDDLSQRDELISYLNNKDRMARDNAELLRKVEFYRSRFQQVFGHLESAIKLAFDPSVDDLSSVVLPEPLPTLLHKRHLG